MDQNLREQLRDFASTGGNAYIRNLAAAEAAVQRGQFNLAKVLRAAAHSQRALAMAAARLLVDEWVPDALLETIGRELEVGEIRGADLETEAGLARLRRVSDETRGIVRRAASSLRLSRDVSENDVAQAIWGCFGCGYLAEGARPDACPVCDALSVEFDRFGPFYSSSHEHLGQLAPEQIAGILASIPAQVSAAVSSVPDAALGRKPAADQWSAKETIGHMLETDLLFARRVTAILQATGIADVPPSPSPWKLHEGKGYENMSTEELLRQQSLARAATMALLGNLAREDWTRQGLIAGSTISVLDLGTWVANHDLGHLAQIREICGGE